eukprot:TRINITY_DN37909_c0_g1_i1.p2 TRINITY_DN37909_c0_g1~~TRINITY_DN37909_c0_g1_i1.p2  ORF type:complete len:123 (-),score=45.86 TRINITY_DN37909_c0_g1_i1:66-434(-)
MVGGAADQAGGPELVASQVAMLEAIQEGHADYASEYGYFGKMQAGWAGAAAKRLKSFKSVMEQGAKTKKEKAVFMIDFGSVDSMDFGNSFKIPTKAGTDQLTEAAITKAYENRKQLLSLIHI